MLDSESGPEGMLLTGILHLLFKDSCLSRESLSWPKAGRIWALEPSKTHKEGHASMNSSCTDSAFEPNRYHAGYKLTQLSPSSALTDLRVAGGMEAAGLQVWHGGGSRI